MTSRKTTSPVAQPRIALTVLGMHRSGTSLLTRVLSLMGADLPDTLIGPSPNNPTGYWESRALRDFNDRLLALTGSQWDDWRPLPEGWERSPKVAEFAEEAAALLESEFGSSRLIVLKDPRMSRLMPFWSGVLDAADLTLRPVLALRNPTEVAASLARRNGFAAELSQLLWLRHMLEAELATRGTARVVTRYDDMMQNWAGAMDRITKGLDLVWPRSPAQISAEVGTLISPEHRHHTSDASLLDSPLVSSWLRDAYAIFDHWADKQERKGDYARLDAIRADLDAAAPAFAPLVDEMRGTKAELAKRIQVIADNQARIKELAGERQKAEEALARTERRARDALAAQTDRATQERNALEAARHEIQAEAKAARTEAQTERQLKEQAIAQLETQAASQADAATLQARVMHKLQQEIALEAERADAAEEDFKTRLSTRTKAQTKNLRLKVEAQAAELETARTALDDQEAALTALQADSAEKAAALAALQNASTARDMALAEQEAALEAARQSLADRDAALAAVQDQMATQEGDLSAQAEKLTALQEALEAAEAEARAQQDAVAETRSALAQKDAELADTRRTLTQAEDAQQEAEQHAQTLERINQSLKREADLEHAHVQTLTQQVAQLTQSLAQNDDAAARMRAEHDQALGAARGQLAAAQAATETRHSELAQLTNLLMQTEAQVHEATAARAAAEAARAEMEQALTALRTQQEQDRAAQAAAQAAEQEAARLAAQEAETARANTQGALAQSQSDVAVLRAGQADIAAVLAVLMPLRHPRFWRLGTGQLRREMAAVRRTGLFDADWYQRTNPDVSETGMDALTHFILYGLGEGRAPRAPQPDTQPDTPSDDTGAPQ
ncbi:hypothetical protein [uncultured Tateyamaria sp.]|uniref:hypothetical protein n=1 Tax=uncultured Tateyamaria sp. TaxID=455651 RepID=UPI002638B5DE|nr:hypothetical protein [uncultured Tateyamaria sp.]